MNNEAVRIIKGWVVHKIALESREEREQMNGCIRKTDPPKQCEITPETSVHVGVPPI